jgi:hypothetical protein
MKPTSPAREPRARSRPRLASRRNNFAGTSFGDANVAAWFSRVLGISLESTQFGGDGSQSLFRVVGRRLTADTPQNANATLSFTRVNRTRPGTVSVLYQFPSTNRYTGITVRLDD